MKRREGFDNEILIVIPPEFYKKSDEITKQLFITDIGYFPKAEEHLVSRDEGCSSNILIICNKGSGWFETGEKRVEIKSGEAIIIPCNTPHKYGSTEDRWWELFWIHYSGVMADESSDRLSIKQKNTPFTIAIGDESRHLFSQICSSLQQGISPLRYELACSRLWHLMGSLVMDKKTGTGMSSGTINECISFMEERISGSLTLEELSRRVSLTPQYLCRLFRKNTGHSPIEHYTQMKVQRACGLLDLTNDRIGEISRRLGVDDPYYFTRIFSRVMGISPRDYRNRQK